MHAALSDYGFVLKRHGRISSGKYRLYGLRRDDALLFIEETTGEFPEPTVTRAYEDEQRTRQILALTGAGGAQGPAARLLLFAGFLGSGKTTLILGLARHETLSGLRVCVIVNEVGEVGIDGEVLRMGELEVKEITAGCICCQIGPDLVRTLRELEGQFRPHLVIVEASGVATPAGVLDALVYYPAEKLSGIETITVVDAARFTELHEVITPLIDSQIAGADRVVITKVDEATAERVDEVCALVRLLAPTAPVYVVDATRDDTLATLIADLAPGRVDS